MTQEEECAKGFHEFKDPVHLQGCMFTEECKHCGFINEFDAECPRCGVKVDPDGKCRNKECDEPADYSD